MTNIYATTEVAHEPLLEQAIADIEQYAPTSWTDTSLSDPGITIIEQLIAQFMTLAEKINLPVNDLLVSGGDINRPQQNTLAYAKPVVIDDQFFSADEVLTCSAVTENDRRRLVLDHPLVANVQVEQVELLENPLFWDGTAQHLSFDELKSDEAVALPGRYRALVELVRDHGLDDSQKAQLSNTLLTQLNVGRNLCEQWQEVIILSPEWIKLKGAVSLTPDADVEQTLLNIHQAIRDYINPPLEAKSRAQLSAQGLSTDEIYQGPRLENGYFDEGTLNQLVVRQELRVSDIIRLVLDFEQVTHVHNLQLSNYDNPQDDDWRDWVLPISSGKIARLQPLIVSDSQGEPVLNDFIECFKASGLCPINVPLLAERLDSQQQLKAQSVAQLKWRNIALPEGFEQTLDYQPVEYLFPAVYGLGDNELPESVGVERLAKVKQLQGFLQLFDQVIANYHQQLADMAALLNSRQRPNRSYRAGSFEVAQQNVTLAEDYWIKIKALVNTNLTDNLDEHQLARENRLLSHLMARLGEQFTDHSLLGFSLSDDHFEQYLAAKQMQLRATPKQAGQRLLAYQDDDGETTVVARLKSKLGLIDTSTLPEQVREDKLALVEHPLLYPQSSTHLPEHYHQGSLALRLLSDGRMYLLLIAAEHGLSDGDRVSIFNIAQDKDSQYGGLYSVKVIDNDTVELPFEFGEAHLNDTEQQFDLRWLRGAVVKNPYAMQVSLVVNRQQGRFNQPDFRQLVEKTARAETPAHIHLNLRWLDDEQWTAFESLQSAWQQAYGNWLAMPDDADSQNTLDIAAAQLLRFML